MSRTTLADLTTADLRAELRYRERRAAAGEKSPELARSIERFRAELRRRERYTNGSA